MTKEETKLAKMDKSLYEEFSRIAHMRIVNHLDKRYSPQKVQKKLPKHPLWWQIKKDLETAKFLDDNRGQFGGQFSVFNLFTIMIVAFLAVVMFGGLIYVMGLLNHTFSQIGIENEVHAGQAGYTNLTYAANITFGQLNNGIQSLRVVALTLIFSLLLGTILSNALMKIHPAFFFVYVLIVLLVVIFSATISNAYESLLQSNVYEGILQSFTGSNFLLLNLPVVMSVVGILGGIFLFVNIIRNTGEQQLQ